MREWLSVGGLERLSLLQELQGCQSVEEEIGYSFFQRGVNALSLRGLFLLDLKFSLALVFALGGRIVNVHRMRVDERVNARRALTAFPRCSTLGNYSSGS